MPAMHLALTLLLGSLPQGDGSLAGRVLDTAGKPLEGAAVTLLHRPIARHFDPPHEHRVVVKTEARGTFRANLRADARYSAWATTDAGASMVAEGITAGDFLELRLEAGARPQALTVTGLADWPEGASFRYRALVGSEAIDFVPIEARDAVLQLPALPPMSPRTIEVLTADGRVLWANQPVESQAGASLAVPPPRQITVQVKDAAGAPLRDVEILAHANNYWATQSPGVYFGDRFQALWPSQGRTDADGRLVLRLPAPPRTKARLWLLSRKAGFRTSLDGLIDDKPFRNSQMPANPPAYDPAAPIDVVLREAAPTELPLRLADGSALATGTLFVVARVHFKRADGGGMGVPFHFPVTVTDGKAVLTAPLPEAAEIEQAWTELAQPVRASLRERLGMPVPAAFRLPFAKRLLEPDAPAQLEASQWQLLQLVGADGRPAANTIVQLREAGEDQGRFIRTDRLGRVPFALRGETYVSVFAAAGVGSLTIAANPREPVTLALQPMHTLRGRVVAGDGRPVPGASITMAVEAEGHGERLPFEHSLLSQQLQVRPSDTDGCFELLLPPFTAKIEVKVTATAGHGTDAFAWDPQQPKPLEITLVR